MQINGNITVIGRKSSLLLCFRFLLTEQIQNEYINQFKLKIEELVSGIDVNTLLKIRLTSIFTN